MAKSMLSYIAYAVLLLCALSVSFIAGEDQKILVDRDDLSLTIPNPFGSTPIFETNDRPGGRYVGLHIPYLFEFSAQHRDGLTNNRFQFKILNGLLEFCYDRAPGADGQSYGPLQLKMLWISLYDNKQQPIAQ